MTIFFPAPSPPLPGNPPFSPHPPKKQFKVVFDAVYTPRETRLLRDASAAGCLVADGVAMFVGQAVEQLKLFTGERLGVVGVGAKIPNRGVSLEGERKAGPNGALEGTCPL